MKKVLFVVFAMLIALESYSQSGNCDATVPFFSLDFSGNPDTLWVSPDIQKVDQCCGAKKNENCVEFEVTLDPDAEGIIFQIAEGAKPKGGTDWQLNCGSTHDITDTICISGIGPHFITFCKPGSDMNKYSISSISAPAVTPAQIVSDGCTGTMTAYGFEESSIQWKSVPSDPFLEGLLDCTSGCSTVNATFDSLAPSTVDYMAIGLPAGGCTALQDTVFSSIKFVQTLFVEILPLNPSICFGGSNTTLTANVVGGDPPYNFVWSSGDSVQSISAGADTFIVNVTDLSSCPPSSDTVVVDVNQSAISAASGGAVSSCYNNPDVILNGNVIEADGGQWTGGSGTYSPSDTDLVATYTPTQIELDAGLPIVHTLTTTGNGTCPADIDQAIQTITPIPTISAGGPFTICDNANNIQLAGVVTNADGGRWSGGSGSFFPHDSLVNSFYNPDPSDFIGDSILLVFSSFDNTNGCLDVKDTLTLFTNNAPTVDAGTDITVCANNEVAQLAGIISDGTSSNWIGGLGSFNPSRVDPNATYTPTNGEIITGSVTLYLQSTDTAVCNPVLDTVVITIIPAPTVSIAITSLGCINSPNTGLQGTVTNATAGIWSGNGSFIFSPDSLNVIFDPDTAEVIAGTSRVYLTHTGSSLCSAVTDSIDVTFLAEPTIDATGVVITCSNAATVNLSATYLNASGVLWSGNGSFSNLDTVAGTVSYTPTTTEIANELAVVYSQTYSTNSCNPAIDSSEIVVLNQPIVDAGLDDTVCYNNADVTLLGTTTFAFSTVWSPENSGTFDPDNTSKSTTYTPDLTDKDNGGFYMVLEANRPGCSTVYDTMYVVVDPLPIIGAGSDQEVCGNNPLVTLNGIQNFVYPVQWESLTGSGTFSASTTLGSNYTPDATEIGNNLATLRIYSQDDNYCARVSDTVDVVITDAPTITASGPSVVCANNSTIDLVGTVTVAAGGSWTGAGTFLSSKDSLTTSYIPTPAEELAGSTTLTFTTRGNGLCSEENDTAFVLISPSPVLSLDPDTDVCANNPTVNLNATVSNAGGIQWTNYTGTALDSDTDTSLVYTLSPQEIFTDKQVVFIVLSRQNGLCNAVSDSLVVTVTDAPTVDAGPGQIVCEDVANLNLVGFTTISSGGNWTTPDGSGGFSAIDVANSLATYTPVAADITADTIELVLTTTGSGKCLDITDSRLIIFDPLATLNAGPAQTVCTNNYPVQLNATGAQGRWSGGLGVYFPNDSTQNAQYTPHADEITAGTVNLTISSLNNGTCAPVASSLTITLPPGPVVTAGVNDTVCSDVGSYTLSGTQQNVNAFQWSAIGNDGSFDNDGILNATYTFGSENINTGFVDLVITTTNITPCSVHESDTMRLFILSQPTVTTGGTLTECADVSGVSVSAVGTNYTSVLWTTPDGQGSLVNDDSLNMTYLPHVDDTTAGTVNFTVTVQGIATCLATSANIALNFTPAPTVDAGSSVTLCADGGVVPISGSFAIATGVNWTTSSIDGSFSTRSDTTVTNYVMSATDTAAGGVRLYLTTTGNGTCNAKVDSIDITINPAPVAIPPVDFTVCADTSFIPLNGIIQNSNKGYWVSSGSGTWQNIDSANAYAEYIPSPVDTGVGTVMFTLTAVGIDDCIDVSEQFQVTISDAPSLTSIPDQIICADAGIISLQSQITTSTGVVWSHDGTGSFDDSLLLSPTYTITNADTVAGAVSFIVETTGNGLCKAIDDTINYTINPAPIVLAGNDQTLCANINSITLNGSVLNSSGGEWKTTNGDGIFSSDQFDLTGSYGITANDTTRGNVTFVLESQPTSTCNTVYDTLELTINPEPIIIVTDMTICADNPVANLIPTLLNETASYWTNSGAGTFTADSSVLNATFTPSAAQIALGSTNLTLNTYGSATCTSVSETMILTIAPAPTVDAGFPQVVCADVDTVVLTGSVVDAVGGKWTTNGVGTFVDSDTLMATNSYVLDAFDRQLSTLYFYLTMTGTGTCTPLVDTVAITINPVPVVNIAQNSLCVDDVRGAEFTGTVSGTATSGEWSRSGDGTFVANNTDTTVTYMPGAADVASGTVQVYYEAKGIQSCNPVIDTFDLTVIPAQIVQAGTDKLVCANNSLVNISGNSQNLLGGTEWITAGSGFYGDSSILATTYTPTAADISLGSVELILTSTNNGDCPIATDTLLVTINPKPWVQATNISVCADVDTVALIGNRTNSTGARWIKSGDGEIINSSSFNTAQYIPGPTDTLNRSTVLYLETTGNGTCLAERDSMVLTFTEPTSAKVGDDITLCADNIGFYYSATVTTATKGIWSTNGTGTLSYTSNDSLNIEYDFSGADLVLDSIDMFFVTTDNGTCLPSYDTATVFIKPMPIVDAGSAVACADNNGVQLNGTSTREGNDAGGTWTTNGTGSFTPNDTTLTARYFPSPADMLAGTVTLYLESRDNGLCSQVIDSVILTINPAPLALAGNDTLLCKDNAFIDLDGTVQNAGGGLWSTLGNGGISIIDEPNANARYTFTSEEFDSNYVDLVLESTLNGICDESYDTLRVNFTEAPTININADLSCIGPGDTVFVDATITVATDWTWSSSGDGVFDDVKAEDPYYIPKVGDLTDTLFITTLVQGICNPINDDLIVNIIPPPTADAGLPTTVCGDTAGVTMTGIQTNATGGVWATLGDGTWSGIDIPNETAIYTPGFVDMDSGYVDLVFASEFDGQCDQAYDTVRILVDTLPTIAIYDTIKCALGPTVPLFFSSTDVTSWVWSHNSDGNFDDPNAAVTNYNFGGSDVAGGQFIVTLTSLTQGLCKSVSDQIIINILPPPTADIGTDSIQVCGDTTQLILVGKIADNAGGGYWNTLGSGSFINADTLTATATYVPDSLDYVNQYVNLVLETDTNTLCSGDQDTAVLYLQPIPMVDGTPDSIICADADTLLLDGLVTNASGANWTTTSGSGSFVNVDVANAQASYLIHNDDTTAGTVDFILTSVLEGFCTPRTSLKTITINSVPIVDIGLDSVCSGDASFQLSGSILNAGGGYWSTNGDGYFLADSNDITGEYAFSFNDATSGSVTLTLHSADAGTCNEVLDSIQIGITPEPTSFAGNDQSACGDADTLQLNGLVEYAGGGVWSTTGTGSFFPDSTALTIVKYTPTSADTAAGSIEFVLTSTGNGLCEVAYDTVDITFTSSPTISVSGTTTNCADVLDFDMSSIYTVASNVIWKTQGSGQFFPNEFADTVVYVASSTDSTAGFVKVYAETDGIGNCTVLLADTLDLLITPPPTISAVIAPDFCNEDALISLTSGYTNSGGVDWISGGDGVFSNINQVGGSADYTPSTGERVDSTITFMGSTVPNNNCLARDTIITVTVHQIAKAFAGADQTLCMDVDTIVVSGNETDAISQYWTTSGTGEFTPDSTSLMSSYARTVNDTVGGQVTLTLTAQGTGPCPAHTDDMIVFFTVPPTLTASTPNVQICRDNTSLQLNTTITVAGGVSWTTDGAGNFATNNLDSDPIYTLDVSDTIADSLSFYVQTELNGTCNPRYDTVVVTLRDIPQVDIGPDLEICADRDSVQVTGTIVDATAAQWGTDGSGNYTDDMALDTYYNMSQADKDNQLVGLFLTTTTGIGTCTPVVDYLALQINEAPTSDIGQDITVCGDTAYLPLSGTIERASGAFWSTSGTGRFQDSTNLNTSYIPSAADTANGSVEIYLTTTGNGLCFAVVDTMELEITPVPTLSMAGIDPCTDKSSISLTSSVTVASGVLWSSTGSGFYRTNRADLTPDYYFTQADADSGKVTFRVTTDGYGLCKPTYIEQDILIRELPTAYAGEDQVVCRGESYTLSAGIYPNLQYSWYDATTALISDSNTALVTAPVDITTVLNVIDQIGCLNRDTVTVFAQDPPNFNMPTQLCYLEGTVLNSNPSFIPADGDYQWYRNDTLLLGEDQLNHIIEGSGYHLMTYQYGLCKESDLTWVSPLPTLSTPDKIICEAASTLLSTTHYLNATYVWSDINGVIGASDTSQITVSVATGDQDFYVNIVDSLNCTFDDSVNVRTVLQPVLQMDAISSCIGDSVTITGIPINMRDTTETWTWYTNKGDTLGFDSTLVVRKDGLYKLSYEVGECGVQDSSDVIFHARPIPQNLSDWLFCSISDMIVTMDAGPASAYVWHADSSTSRYLNAYAEGTYSFSIFNEYDCNTEDTMYVKDICPPVVTFPNAIRPGCDCDQGGFGPKGYNFVNYNLTIYNRWGEVIFYSEDPEEQWDGYFNDKKMPIGVYPYIVEYYPAEVLNEADREQIRESGIVTVIE